MSKHTPGPWRVASDQNSVGNTVWAGDLPVALCSPVRVFLASRQTAQITGAEASANARLIAAAPELLEALDQLLNGTLIHEHTHNDNGLEELAARCGSTHVAAELRKLAGIARAAIKKVEEGK